MTPQIPRPDVVSGLGATVMCSFAHQACLVGRVKKKWVEGLRSHAGSGDTNVATDRCSTCEGSGHHPRPVPDATGASQSESAARDRLPHNAYCAKFARDRPGRRANALD